MTQYAASAWDAIQQLFDDGASRTLADRVEAVLDLLDAGGTDSAVRRHRTFSPTRWTIPIYGSDREWYLIWHPDPSTGEPYVIYAGPAPLNG